MNPEKETTMTLTAQTRLAARRAMRDSLPLRWSARVAAWAAVPVLMALAVVAPAPAVARSRSSPGSGEGEFPGRRDARRGPVIASRPGPR